MYYTKQDDYDNFKCIAGACPKTCCKNWLIEIDQDSLSSYQEYKGAFKDHLVDGINWNEGTFKLVNKRCFMLNSQNLCDMQLNMGEEALCYTCQMYPRHTEEYDDLQELSLSMSCPEVARMVVNRRVPYTFVESEDDVCDCSGSLSSAISVGEFESDSDSELNIDDEFDFFLHSSLEFARDKIFEILQNRDENIFSRLANVLNLCKQLQNCIDEDKIFDMDEVTEGYSFQEDIDSEKFLSISFDMLQSIEVFEDSFYKIVKDVKKYQNAQVFAKLTSLVTTQESIALENIASLFIFTYFCGAVYDDRLYSKAALCIISTYWIYLYYRSTTQEENLPLLEEALYNYASEVVHSEENIAYLEDALSSF